MANDSSYKIRLELLRMARGMFHEDYEKECQKIHAEWEQKNKGGSLHSHPGFPKYPSEDEIIKKARNLNSFISKKFF